jgi:hypothetical protein
MAHPDAETRADVADAEEDRFQVLYQANHARRRPGTYSGPGLGNGRPRLTRTGSSRCGTGSSFKADGGLDPMS